MFDLQAHRGGSGLVVENTLPAFHRALHLGVTTLECDVHVSADGVAMVTHDPVVSAAKATDTGDQTYVGRRVTDLTAAQLQTLDCGSATRPEFPRQQAAPGARMPTLAQVLDLVVDEPGVRVNVETKVGLSADAAARARFVEAVLRDVRAAGLVDRVSVQSFDWAVLRLIGRVSPRTPRYALVSPGRPVVVGELAGAVAALGFTAVSPVHGVPVATAGGRPGYRPFVTPALVASAHEHGLRVVPWTVNDEPTMIAMLDLGVDGLITDYPDLARDVLAGRGITLPAPVPPRPPYAAPADRPRRDGPR